jgi:putative endonuclease
VTTRGPRRPSRPDPRRALGTRGEDAVARWYEARGYSVLDRNWRVREGELDLVLRHGRTLVFCEVKTRRGDAFGSPFDAVTTSKQRRLRTLALRWLTEHEVRGVALRFDVAAVRAAPDSRLLIEVRTGAF